MAYYRIKNLTHLLAKRHIQKDSTLDIQFVSGLEKRTHKLPIKSEIYIACTNLPISVHKLRMKKLVSVREVNQNEFFKAQQPKPIIKPTPVVELEVEKPVVIPKKKITPKKKTTDETTLV